MFSDFVLLGSDFSVPSQETGWEERLLNDLFCLERDVKPYPVQFGSTKGWCTLKLRLCMDTPLTKTRQERRVTSRERPRILLASQDSLATKHFTAPSSVMLPFLCIHIRFLLTFSFFSVLHFLVVGFVRWIKLTHVGFQGHAKTASRIVSYSDHVK